LSQLTADAVELGQYRHYMQKEIFEQPMAVANTLEMVTGPNRCRRSFFGADAERVLRDVDSVLILACGRAITRGWSRATGSKAGGHSVQRRNRERVPLSGVGAQPEGLVSRCRSPARPPIPSRRLQYAKSLGHRCSLSICNVPESALVRASDLRFLTRAGPEIGVASTKAFTTQLAALYCSP